MNTDASQKHAGHVSARFGDLSLPRRICYVETQDRAFLAHRKHLGRAALDAGMEVHVIAPGGDRSGELNASGFIYHALRMRRSGVNPWSEADTVRHLMSLYREIQPQLVHNIALKSVLYGSAAARLVGIPAVGSITGLGYTFIPGGSRRFVLRESVSLLLRGALRGSRVHTIFQNPDDQSLFIRKKLVREVNTTLIYGSGVDTERFAPSPEPNTVPRVLVATRMLRDKGVVELIAAARILRQRNVAFELLLAGEPDPENPASIEASELRAWHAEGIARWIGHSADIDQLLRDVHIACLPSYREGLPLFLAEAAASGRAAVTTDVPGCRSVVQHGRTGFLVPARESQALADALQRLLTDASLRRRMAAEARTLAVERFAKDRVSDAIFRIYSALLSS